jgi:hypothetical protein
VRAAFPADCSIIAHAQNGSHAARAVAVIAAAAPQNTAWGDPDLQGIWAQKYQTP